jgi:hypothetical protein
VAHAWIPLREFELTKFQHTLSTRHTLAPLLVMAESAPEMSPDIQFAEACR